MPDTVLGAVDTRMKRWTDVVALTAKTITKTLITVKDAISNTKNLSIE